MPLQALAFHLLHGAKAWGSSVLIVIPRSEKCAFVNTLELLSSGHGSGGTSTVLLVCLLMQELESAQVT